MFTVHSDSNTVAVALDDPDPATIVDSFQRACRSRGLLVPDSLIADGNSNGSAPTARAATRRGFTCWIYRPVPGWPGAGDPASRSALRRSRPTITKPTRPPASRKSSGNGPPTKPCGSRCRSRPKAPRNGFTRPPAATRATVAAHPYLIAKGVTEIAAQAGCRVQKNVLLIPLFDASGTCGVSKPSSRTAAKPFCRVPVGPGCSGRSATVRRPISPKVRRPR